MTSKTFRFVRFLFLEQSGDPQQDQAPSAAVTNCPSGPSRRTPNCPSRVAAEHRADDAHPDVAP